MQQPVALLVGFILIFIVFLGTVSCDVWNPGVYPIWKVSYAGHTYEEVVSAINEGRVKSARVSIDQDTKRPVGLALHLADGENWSLRGNDNIEAAVAVLDSHNATASESARVAVHEEPSYGAPTPVSPNPSPTSNPRPP
jgi:hypothetical protein